MDLKHGSIITLDNGDKVRVSLEVIKEKVRKLVPGRYYKLTHSGQHCHTYNPNKGMVNINDYSDQVFQYVGTVDSFAGLRYIFYTSLPVSIYSMWSTENLNFVVEEIKQ
jgi:predicted ribosome quality control (RQC) complex YloA/Tae2 family protein